MYSIIRKILFLLSAPMDLLFLDELPKSSIAAFPLVTGKNFLPERVYKLLLKKTL